MWLAFMLSAGESGRAQNGKPLFTAPLGVEAYTFRKSFPIDAAKTLDTIKMMGFVEIEGGGDRMPRKNIRNCVMKGVSASPPLEPVMSSW